ncbi:MAG: hypothetical protein PHP69_06470 [Candidatus Omnitrophica bacterium]|nr:hypothetical protein [Candidatus Omnitrophota bacterium]
MRVKLNTFLLYVLTALICFYSSAMDVDKEQSINEMVEKNIKVEDPFEPLLPKESETSGLDTGGQIKEAKDLVVAVEGIMWGSDVPMAIIDGEVYKEGDVIISNGAKLYKIENNEVLIYYDGRLHKRKVGVQPEKGDNL